MRGCDVRSTVYSKGKVREGGSHLVTVSILRLLSGFSIDLNPSTAAVSNVMPRPSKLFVNGDLVEEMSGCSVR